MSTVTGCSAELSHQMRLSCQSTAMHFCVLPSIGSGTAISRAHGPVHGGHFKERIAFSLILPMPGQPSSLSTALATRNSQA